MSKAGPRFWLTTSGFRPNWRIVVPGLVVLLLLVAVGISAWRSGHIGIYRSERSVRGILVDVQGASIVFAESVTLRSDDGVIYEFQVDQEVATNREEPQSASHLRQHMVLGEAVIVRYRESADGPVAIRILDADR